ncbi:MAG: transglycosylase domain-containing protein [Victivallaceae bacterium]|nr:transglycosylase domain-containing protein [Victivallaceae bacterium]
MKYRAAIVIFAGAAAAAMVLMAVWLAAPYFASDPLELLAAEPPSRRYFDAAGVWVHSESAPGWRWRFDVPLARVSPEARQVMLAAEDIDFYRHGGVDYPAVLRAAAQNLLHGKIVSGASTITMQLAGLSLERKRGSFTRKFVQAARARKLELLYSKDRIFGEYLNRIPFGGQLYGIEAASLFYFGRPAAELNTAEASLLCGLPQKPNFYRPDRHLDRARLRQKRVLGLLSRHGVLTMEEAGRLYDMKYLRFRNFKLPPQFMELARPDENTHFFQVETRLTPAAGDIQTRLDSELQAQLLILLRRRASAAGCRDAAAAVVENTTGRLIALVGTLDFARAGDGEVNAALAVRSAGSTLKPFIYAAALDAGFITPLSPLDDAPVDYGGYAPGNFDGIYRGRVSAQEALSYSLNTPAVRLLARLGEKRMTDTLKRFGLCGSVASSNGLALALGSAGYRLTDLVCAYCRLFSGQGGGVSHSASLAVAQMLRSRPLAGTAFPAAWKTGTSNNGCDAWCFAGTPEYTLGVWLGNKSGERVHNLTGAGAAAPAAGEIVELLYSRRPFPAWPPASDFLVEELLCAASGLAPGTNCVKRVAGPALRGLPPARCRQCGVKVEPIRIIEPGPGMYMAGASGFVELALAASRPVKWLIDGKMAGEKTSYRFAPGRHRVTAIPEAPAEPVWIEFGVTPAAAIKSTLD